MRIEKTLRLVLAPGLAGLVAGGSVARAQVPQDAPTFRATTELIVQTVTVTDAEGNPIEGLTAQDFLVVEDGEPQEIAFVEFQRLRTDPARRPLEVDERPGIPEPPRVTQTELARPPPGDTRFRDRRLLLLYFDLTAMPPQDQLRAYDAALDYVGARMTPADLIAIMAFEGGAVRVKQDFTDDREQLRAIIYLLIYGEDKDGDGVRDAPDMGGAFGQNDAEFNIFNTDRQLSALQTAVTMLRPFPEQKALVYFASGLRLNGTDNHAQLRATTNAAIRSNTTIHPVDARGLVATAPLGNATEASPGGLGMFTGRLAEASMTRFQRSQDTLYALARDTGGEALFDYNDLALGIERAAQSQTSYYMLGYYSTHPETDGRFRRVEIALADGRRAELSYRQGYYGDKTFARLSGAERERQLEEALMLENPVTDITIAMEVNYFQLNAAEYFVPVAVKIPGSELELARRRGAQRTVLDFIGEVKTSFGYTIQNVRDRLDIRLDAETATELVRRPVQYESGFTLLPDDYVIKFLVRDATTGRIGTYQTSFTVPNLNREQTRLPISSVVLGSQRVTLDDALESVPSDETLAANPLVRAGEKLLPSVTRVFSRQRDLYVYVQAYEREADDTRPLVAFVSFFRGDEKISETAPVAVREGMHPRSKAVPIRLTVPLEGLEPGPYEVQVSVLEPATEKAAFWRTPIVVVQ